MLGELCTRREFLKVIGFVYIASQLEMSGLAQETVESSMNYDYIPWVDEPEITESKIYFGMGAGIGFDGQLSLLKIDGSVQEITLPPGYTTPWGVRFSPQGDRLAVWIRSLEKGSTKREQLFLIDPSKENLPDNPLSDNPIFDTYTAQTQGFVEWSKDGRRLMTWTIPNAVVSVPLTGTVRVFDGENKIFERSNTMAYEGGTSPDGKWILLAPDVDLNSPYVFLVNIDTNEQFKLPTQSGIASAWSPDGSLLIIQAENILNGFLRFDLATKRELSPLKLASLPFPASGWESVIPLAISSDNKLLLFQAQEAIKAGQINRDVLFVMDMDSGEVNMLAFGKHNSLNKHLQKFVSDKELQIITPDQNSNYILLTKLNLGNGEKTERVLALLPDFLNYARLEGDRLVCYRLIQPNLIRLETYSLNDGTTVEIGEIKKGSPDYSFDFWVKELRQGDIISADTNYLVGRSRRYVIGDQARHIVGKAPINVTPALISKVPESINQLPFKNGDVLVSNGVGWLIRNNQRFRMHEHTLEEFIVNRRFNQALQEVPGWVIDLIPEGPKVHESTRFVTLWGGQTFESDAPLALVWWSGLGTSSDVMWGKIEKIFDQGLKQFDWEKTRIILATYNIEQKRDGFTIGEFTFEHSIRSPAINFVRAKWLVQWLKIQFPRTKFIFAGHSQGGCHGVSCSISQP